MALNIGKATAENQHYLYLFSIPKDHNYDYVIFNFIPNMLAELLNESECEQYLLTTIKEAAGDKSWRVRYMLSDKFSLLQKAIGPQLTTQHLVPAFQVHIFVF